MPDCPKCHVTYYEGESHNCRGIGRERPRRGAGFHFVIAWFAGGLLGALVGLPILYLVRSEAVLMVTMGLGMLITFMWLRLRN